MSRCCLLLKPPAGDLLEDRHPMALRIGPVPDAMPVLIGGGHCGQGSRQPLEIERPQQQLA